MTKSSRLPTNSLDYINKSVLPALMKHRYAWPFLTAVDFVALNLPDYPKIIRQPMDFSKVKEKLRKNLYFSPSECVKDISTIFTNCYLFNPPDEDVVYMALKLDFILKEKMKDVSSNYASTPLTNIRASVPSNIKGSVNSCDKISNLNGKRKFEESEPRLSNKILKLESINNIKERPILDKDDLAKCTYIIKEIMSSKYQKLNSMFLHPVDVKKLNILDYFDTIKKPMDLNTIKSKLEATLYNTKEKFVDDIELVFSNCIKYNGEGTELGSLSKRFQEVFRKIYAKTFSSIKQEDIPIKSTVVTPPAIVKSSIKPEKLKPTPQKVSQERSQPPETLEKNKIIEMLSHLEKRQDDVTHQFKKVQELISVQNSEIEELYKKCFGTNISIDKLENNGEFGDAGSLISNMSESILSSSASIVSNSRKDKRQIQQPKNQPSNTIVTPKSVKKVALNNPKSNSKKRIIDTVKTAVTAVKTSKAMPYQREQSNNKAKTKVTEEYQSMTYDEKKRLSININQLWGDQLTTVVKIIQLNEISLRSCDPDDIDIDFETLQPKTLRELESFVSSVISGPKMPVTAITNGRQGHNESNTRNKNASDEFEVRSTVIANMTGKQIRETQHSVSKSHSSSASSSSSDSSDSSSSESNRSIS